MRVGVWGKVGIILPTGKKEWMQERAFINEYDLQNSSNAALGTDQIREGVWQVLTSPSSLKRHPTTSVVEALPWVVLVTRIVYISLVPVPKQPSMSYTASPNGTQ